jgi:hypothetical protein
MSLDASSQRSGARVHEREHRRGGRSRARVAGRRHSVAKIVVIHVPKVEPVGERADDVDRPVRRAVVGHDHLEPVGAQRLPDEAVESLAQPARALERGDDNRDLGIHAIPKPSQELWMDILNRITRAANADIKLDLTT